MTDIAIKTECLGKYFFLPHSDHSAFSFLKHCIQGKSFFYKKTVLKDISIEIGKGRKTALIGPNGAGKSTLMRTLAGMYQKSSGDLRLADYPNVIFQNWIDINGDSSLAENIELFGVLYGISGKIIRELMREILEYSELTALKDTPFKKVSLGEQQRLALATFSHSPGNILLFDESFNIVDDRFKTKFETLFQSRLSGKTCLIASHDLPFLEKICDYAIWMDSGMIKMQGTVPDIFSAYRNMHSKKNQ